MREQRLKGRARRKPARREVLAVDVVHPEPVLAPGQDDGALYDALEARARGLEDGTDVAHGLVHLGVEVALGERQVEREGRDAGEEDEVAGADGLRDGRLGAWCVRRVDGVRHRGGLFRMTPGGSIRRPATQDRKSTRLNSSHT